MFAGLQYECWLQLSKPVHTKARNVLQWTRVQIARLLIQYTRCLVDATRHHYQVQRSKFKVCILTLSKLDGDRGND